MAARKRIRKPFGLVAKPSRSNPAKRETPSAASTISQIHRLVYSLNWDRVGRDIPLSLHEHREGSDYWTIQRSIRNSSDVTIWHIASDIRQHVPTVESPSTNVPRPSDGPSDALVLEIESILANTKPSSVVVSMDPGNRHEPVIRDKGVSAAILAAYHFNRGFTAEQISEMWEGSITAEEVADAIDYAETRPEMLENANESTD